MARKPDDVNKGNKTWQFWSFLLVINGQIKLTPMTAFTYMNMHGYPLREKEWLNGFHIR